MFSVSLPARATIRPLAVRRSAIVLFALLGFALPLHAAGGGPEVTFEAEDGKGLATLTLVNPPPRWIAVGDAFVPQVEGYGSMERTGAPDLPARRERIALPAGARLRIAAVEIDWEEGRLPGTPARYPAFAPDRKELAPEWGERSGFWPASPVELVVADGALRTTRFATLELRPLAVDPANGRFRFARRVTLRLDRGLYPGGARRMRSLTGEAATPFVHGAAEAGPTALNSGSPSTAAPQPAGAALGYPAWEFAVEGEGIYRVSYAWAQANAPALLNDFLIPNDPQQYRLQVQGVEVPILVAGEADHSFDPGDAILFYGQPVEGDPFAPDTWEQGDFTDVNVYRLDLATAPSRIAAVPSAPTNATIPPSFPETARMAQDRRFQGFVPAAGDDHWYADPLVVALSAAQEESWIVDTPGDAGAGAELRVRLLGIKGYDSHRSEIRVDGSPVDSADWDGFTFFTHGVDTPPIALGGALLPTTQVSVRLPLGRPGQSRDAVGVDWVEIDYQRRYEATGDRLLFTVAADGDYQVQLAGLSAVSGSEIWEAGETVTSAAGLPIITPRRLTGVADAAGKAAFDVDQAAPQHRFAAAGPTGFLTPIEVHQDLPPDALDASLAGSLRSPANGADWLLIGGRDLLDLSPGSQLEQLLLHRQAQGLQTAVVAIDDVYDEFSDSLSDPQALRDFLSYTLGQLTPGEAWSPAPRYVVLLGDGSWDHKNNYGHPAPRQIVPTYMFDIPENSQFGHYPSDTWFAAVVGQDELPDLSLGRIPAHDLAEAEEVFRKIRVYESGVFPPSAPGRTCMVSENGADFYEVHDTLWSRWFSGAPQPGDKLYETVDDEDCLSPPLTPQNDRIDGCINAGAALVSFSGHGGYKSWGNGCSFFTSEHDPSDPNYPNEPDESLADIADDTPLYVTIHANCITGNFSATSSTASTNDNWYTLVEDWLTTSRKAAVAGFAPSHLTYVFELHSILDPFYEEIFGKRKQRELAQIETRLRADFDQQNKAVLLRSFIFEGDPATQMTIPAPDPPQLLSVDKAGSGELTVSWTSVPGAAHYRVYRSSFWGGNYVLAGDNITGTSFTDSGLRNCQTYYYYVVSVDGQGFESRWSNYNDTCGDASPDPAECKSGSPENPVPPHAPTAPGVMDTQKGGQLQVSWDNTDRESDVERYHVFWGTTPGGPYPNERTTGAQNNSLLLTGLENRIEHYVEVRAANCTRLGDPTAELAGTPHEVRGINPPDSIGDLRVLLQPDAGDGIADLRLEWTPPGETVWGVTTNLAAIEVHGSTLRPDFTPSAATQLSQPALGPGAASWVHENQGVANGQRWYYLVIAEDDQGRRSAGGTELPAGISDLTLVAVDENAVLPPERIDMSWSAVDRTMDPTPGGQPQRIAISGYSVYGRPSVLPRPECGDANRLTPSPLAQASASFTIPAGTLYTYQVLAVDHHGNEAVW